MSDKMQHIGEEWRSVGVVEGIDFDGLYEVSNLGRVRSLDRPVKCVRRGVEYTRIQKGKLMRLHLDKDGYLRVGLRSFGDRRTTSVHRLVAKAFIKNALALNEINHKNGIKTDNQRINLEWVTRHENMRHAYESGLIPKN